MGQRKAREVLGKIWHFFWHDESVWSWLVTIVVAFVIIKFIFYPGLGLLLGTKHPVVAVVSGSMEHQGRFDGWWNHVCFTETDLTTGERKTISQADIYSQQNITREQFVDFPFSNGFNKGDLMIISSARRAEVGDILVFMTTQRREPIIHRAIGRWTGDGTTFFKTKGDWNCGTSGFEQEIPGESVLGKGVIRVPFLGWIKIGFVALLRAVLGLFGYQFGS